MTKEKETWVLNLYDPAELLIVKSALVNFKKAPFISKQEMIIIDEVLDRINAL
jgi:hypothetical protein